MLPVTTIMQASCRRVASWCEAFGDRKIDRVLRPALQCRAAGIGENIDAALGAVEPAIDVVQKYLWRVRNPGLQIAHPARALRQRRGTGQRLLTIGGHDRRARAAA